MTEKSAIPTKPGWYFGQFRKEEIEPYHVDTFDDRKTMFADLRGRGRIRVTDKLMRWYGEVVIPAASN